MCSLHPAPMCEACTQDCRGRLAPEARPLRPPAPQCLALPAGKRRRRFLAPSCMFSNCRMKDSCPGNWGFYFWSCAWNWYAIFKRFIGLHERFQFRNDGCCSPVKLRAGLQTTHKRTNFVTNPSCLVCIHLMQLSCQRFCAGFSTITELGNYQLHWSKGKCWSMNIGNPSFMTPQNLMFIQDYFCTKTACTSLFPQNYCNIHTTKD